MDGSAGRFRNATPRAMESKRGNPNVQNTAPGSRKKMRRRVRVSSQSGELIRADFVVGGGAFTREGAFR
jgi:hypothetical protein